MSAPFDKHCLSLVWCNAVESLESFLVALHEVTTDQRVVSLLALKRKLALRIVINRLG